ncbi:hypothetical protein KEM60_01767 [Austwickia sp. TVS 96-490-7B]|nr:hypothetical protein [Austwickia sp. TVS 96-490-7B]
MFGWGRKKKSQMTPVMTTPVGPDFSHPAPATHLVGEVLFPTTPAFDQVYAALTERVDGEITQTHDGYLQVNAPGSTTIVTVCDGPLPIPDVAATCHPLFWQRGTAPVEAHGAHVLISTRSAAEPTGASDEAAARAHTQALASVHGMIGSAIAQMDDAIAYFMASTMTTMPADVSVAFTLDCLANNTLSGEMWRPVWVRPAAHSPVDATGFPTTWTAYTSGLAAFGHAELQIESAPRTPNELFDILTGIASYVFDGATLYPGDTMGSSHAVSHTVTASVSLLDGVTPALSITI